MASLYNRTVLFLFGDRAGTHDGIPDIPAAVFVVADMDTGTDRIETPLAIFGIIILIFAALVVSHFCGRDQEKRMLEDIDECLILAHLLIVGEPLTGSQFGVDQLVAELIPGTVDLVPLSADPTCCIR